MPMAAFADDDNDNNESNLIANKIEQFKCVRVGASESVQECRKQNNMRLPRLFAISASSTGLK